MATTGPFGSKESASVNRDSEEESSTLISYEEDAGGRRWMRENFQPGESDMVCGRGRQIFWHKGVGQVFAVCCPNKSFAIVSTNASGNVRFRHIVRSRLGDYIQARSRAEKSSILAEVVAKVRVTGGGFVKKAVDGRWFDVGNCIARERTSQAFRDALHGLYKSSSSTKSENRRTMRKLKRKQSPVKTPAAVLHVPHPPDPTKTSSSDTLVRISTAALAGVQNPISGGMDSEQSRLKEETYTPAVLVVSQSACTTHQPCSLYPENVDLHRECSIGKVSHRCDIHDDMFIRLLQVLSDGEHVASDEDPFEPTPL